MYFSENGDDWWSEMIGGTCEVKVRSGKNGYDWLMNMIG